ncbi:GNAT family N-acetyltransferase [Chryseolinea serpens]|nr:GNAT family N-acetyltransferase [Chryseolinea serpens]
MEKIMNTAVTIRNANLDDAALLAELGWKTFYETFAPLNNEADVKLYVDKNFTTERLIQELEDPHAIFLIAQAGDTVAGYAKLRTQLNPDAPPDTVSIELERIYSDRDFLGKSVGKTLMQASIDLAKQRGCDTLWLGVWEFNPRAIAFYEKWGFEKFSSHPFLLGTDLQTDLLYKKKLT